ncbi:MAG TPA: hypothetical protein ENF73_02020, partial [Proteobacteria bacterium]|nr:hypothetical protein [Pseudomonadota bacterium]
YHGDFHHFCVVDVYPDGTVDVQVIRHGEGTTPDSGYSFSVQWTDRIPPIVEQTYPADGQQDVDVASSISVVFSEPMDPDGTGLALSITPEVEGRVEWYDDRTLVFVPSHALEGGTRYTVTIAEDATDVAGNMLDGDRDGRELGAFMFSFETAPGDGADEGGEEEGLAGCGCEF